MSFIRLKHQSYVQVFSGEHGKRVLGDLARFCHANSTTYVNNDPAGSAQLEGRRQVILRIQAMMGLTGEQLSMWEKDVKTEEYELND